MVWEVRVVVVNGFLMSGAESSNGPPRTMCPGTEALWFDNRHQLPVIIFLPSFCISGVPIMVVLYTAEWLKEDPF